jgi:hypothetical protein
MAAMAQQPPATANAAAGAEVTLSVSEREKMQKEINNPIADFMALDIQQDFYLKTGPNRSTMYEVSLRPMMSVPLGPRMNLLARAIAPIGRFPDVVQGLPGLPSNAAGSSGAGVGDLGINLWLTPAHLPRAGRGELIYGGGPVLSFPTATSDALGTGKYFAGPSLIFGYMRGRIVTGTLVQNVWSYAGDRLRANVNQMTLEPFLSYELPREWTATVWPSITADWTTTRQRWGVPLDAGASKLLFLGKLPVSVGAEFSYYVQRPVFGPQWNARMNVKFVLPSLIRRKSAH